MSSRAKDTGFLRNLITYDGPGNITLPALLYISNNKEVATKEYVDAQNSGQVLQSRTLTINGVTYDLSANRSWTIDSMVYPSAGIALSSGTGWGTSIANNSANWNTAFGWGNHASAGYVPYTGATESADLGVFSLTATGITANSFYARGSGIQGGYIYLKQGGTPYGTLAGANAITADGTKYIFLSDAGSNNSKTALLDLSSLTNNTNRTFTLPDASGTIALISNLTGFELLSNKSNNASLGLSDVLYPTQGAVKSYVDSAVTGGVNIQGDWNANTNSPNISGTTTTGFTWRVSTAGSTNLGGITVWNVNDLAVKTASGWIKIDNSSSVISVYGRQGIVVANAGDYNTSQVTESVGSLYFTTARARASFSAGTNVSIDVNGVISSVDTAYSNFTRTVAGLVPNPGGATTTKYLREDGTWQVPPDTDTNTWVANAKDVAGYVAAPVTATANKVWKTDATGNPAWRDDADTITTSLAWTSITGRPTVLSSFTNDLGNYGSFLTSYTETDTLGSVTNRGNTTSQNIVFTNGRKGLVGVYDAAQTQAIFAMGAAYVLTDGGASNTIGSLYGLAWSYNPDYGAVGNNPQSKAGLNHQLLLMQNGVTTAAMGSGIWTSGNVTGSSFIGTTYWTSVSGRPTTLSSFTNDLGNYGGWVVRSGDSMSGRLTIDSRATDNLPLHVLSVEPYIQLQATGTSNSTSFRMYPTGGFSAFVGNYATGSLVLVAANTESVFVSGNGNVTSNGGWFINNATFRGLHNSATSMYFASKDSGYYDISSTGTSVCSLRLFTGGNQTTIRGYVYADTNNDVGFLTSAGNWVVRCNSSGVTLYGSSGSTGSFAATKYTFGSNNTLSGNGLVEIVDMAAVGMATQAASYRWYNSTAAAILMSLNSSGHLTANAFFEASDIRYKDVIETNPDITGLGIDVIKFTRHGSDMIRYGYSAQQVQSIIPESVYGEDTLTVNYMDVHTLKIASLERRVKELEAKLK